MFVLQSDVNMHASAKQRGSKQRKKVEGNKRQKLFFCLLVFTLNDKTGLIRPINAEWSHILFVCS